MRFATNDMPASSTENCAYIEETLKSSIAGKKSVDSQLLSSAKRILLSKIDFKPAEKPYSLQIDSLRSKYIPLNPSKDYTQLSSATDSNGRTNGSKMISNSDGGDNFPTPQIVLYPEDKVKLEWKRLQKVGAGLVNMGNTCFLNSTLQCLTYTAPLVNYCLSDEHTATCKQLGFCMMCELQRHIKRSNENAGNSIKPQSILQKLKMIAKHMQWGRQEDAHEFLRYVVDAMQRACLNGYTKLDKFSKETTVVNQIFGGFLRSQVQCMKCKEKSNTYDPFMDISLDIKTAQTLEKALEKYVMPETLDNDNAYMCTNCKQKVPAHKRFSIHKAPNVLTLSLKRFDYHRLNGKISRHVHFPEQFNLRPYMSTRQGDPVKYNLYAVLVHSGYHCNAGHYYCYIKSPSQIWYCMNDSLVQQVSASRVLSSEAYLLFYIKAGATNASRQKMPGISPNMTNNHVINNKKFKVLNGMTGHSSNDIGSPIIRNLPNSVNHHENKSSASGTALPDKREKVAFGIRPHNTTKSQSEGSGDAKPRIVMQIKNGKVTTYEKSPNGKSKIVNGPDNRSGLVPYGEDSDSDSENKTKISKMGKKKSPPKGEKNQPKESSPNSFKEALKRKIFDDSVVPDKKRKTFDDSVVFDKKRKTFDDSVVFDKTLNATTSVPGNMNLLETAFGGKDKRLSCDIKTSKKLDGLNLMVSKPKDAAFRYEKDSAPFKNNLLESSSISCVTAGTLHLGKQLNSTSKSWHILNQDGAPSPSIGSNSSKDSVNSTTEWHVIDKNEVLHYPKVPERQFLGWKISGDKINGDLINSNDNHMNHTKTSNVMRESGLSGKENENSAHIQNINAKNEKREDCSLFNPQGSLEKQTRSNENNSIKPECIKHTSTEYICASDVNHISDNYVNVSDKQKLLSGDDTEYRRSHKKHKKHKKHKRSHSDVKYEELVNESDVSIDTVGKKQKKKKHKRHKRDEDREDDSKKHKLDQDVESDNSSEFVWVEKTKDSLDDTKDVNQNAVPTQTWDHHVKDGYKRQRNGIQDTKANSWDGSKSSKVAEELEKQYSVNGYGASVNSWDGGQNTLDKDLEKDRLKDRKRHWSDDYDEDFDKGRTKKVKKSHSEHSYHSYNPFQSVQDDKNRWRSKEPVKSQSYHGHSNNHSSSHHHSNNYHQSNRYHRDFNRGYHSSSTHSSHRH